MKAQIKKFLKNTGNYFLDYDYIDEGYISLKVDKTVELLQEEITELRDASAARDVTETLGAVIGIGVYYNQLVMLLEQAGIDYQAACEKICDNNSLKYTASSDLAFDWLEQCQEAGWNYYVSGVEVDGVTWYCLKDTNTHKVKKHMGFEEVCLNSCIPEKLLNE